MVDTAAIGNPVSDSYFAIQTKKYADANSIPLSLLQAITKGIDRNNSYQTVEMQISNAADNLAAAMRLTPNSKEVNQNGAKVNAPMTSAEYQQAILDTFYKNPANTNGTADQTVLAKTANAAANAIQSGATDASGNAQISLWEFIKKEFTIRTFITIAVAVFLLWHGLNGLVSPTAKAIKGAVSD